MVAIKVTDQDFKEKVLESTIPVLVDFYAEWCGPCKMAGPIIDEMAEEYKDRVLMVKLDVDQNQETAGKYGVMSIPTMILFKQGKEVERKVGFGGRSGIEALIKAE